MHVIDYKYLVLWSLIKAGKKELLATGEKPQRSIKTLANSSQERSPRPISPLERQSRKSIPSPTRLQKTIVDEAAFISCVGKCLARRRRHGKGGFTVLYIDLDQFKLVKESLGYSAGKRLIAETSRRFAASIREEDTLARFTGDKYGVLLDGTKEITDSVHAALRLQEALRSPIVVADHEVYCSASIGIAWGGTNYQDPQQLVCDAEAAMNRAKGEGRGRYAIFDVAMHEQACGLLRIETDLHRALEQEEFQLHYQPIISLDTFQIRGFEALLRWNHPERGLLYPGDFLFVAERTGLLVPMTRWVLQTAWQQVGEWQRKLSFPDPLIVSCNTSAKYVAREELVHEVATLASERGLDPTKLAIEVTEEQIIDNPELVSRVLTELSRLGVRIYLDDFGTGFSSLSYLSRLPFDTLKIDRSFVQGLENYRNQFLLVQGILSLARSLNISVIAEGIETKEQLESLKSIGCPRGQGYYFSRPLDGQGVAKFAKKMAKQ
jgi:diguanylate cyclase (GGDEF)-like protein